MKFELKNEGMDRIDAYRKIHVRQDFKSEKRNGKEIT
jgi:hypothetical protein